MGDTNAMKAICIVLARFLLIDPQGAFRLVLSKRAWLAMLLVIQVSAAITAIASAPVELSDSVYALLNNPRIPESARLAESEMRDALRLTPPKLASAAFFSALWASVDAFFFAGFVTLAAMLLAKQVDFRNALGIVSAALFMPYLVGPCIEIPFAYYQNSFFRGQIGLSAFLFNPASIQWYAYVLEQANFFTIVGMLLMASGVKVLTDASYKSALAIVCTAWALKTAYLTIYLVVMSSYYS